MIDEIILKDEIIFKEKKLPIAIIPATILMLITVTSSVLFFRVLGFTLRYAPTLETSFLILPAVYVCHTIALHFKNRWLIILSIVFEIGTSVFLYLVIKDLTIKHPTFLHANLNIWVLIFFMLPKFLLLYVGVRYYNKGIKKPLFIIMCLLFVISDIVIYLGTKNSSSNKGTSEVICIFNILIMYWFMEPYKVERNKTKTHFSFMSAISIHFCSPIISFVKNFNCKKSVITVLLITFIVLLGENLLINRYFNEFEYTDEEIENLSKLAETEDEVVLEMASKLEFNNEPFPLPHKANDLPVGVYIEKMFPLGLSKEYTIIPYDMTCALLYNNEFVTFVDKVPGEAGEIYSIYISNFDRSGEFFTVDGIGLGSTEEELLKKFPDYVSNEQENMSNETRKSYFYVDEELQTTKTRKGLVSFSVEDGIVESILVSITLPVY